VRLHHRRDDGSASEYRYYAGEASPLSNAPQRYSDFFRLFSDFRGYVQFFLLQELVVDECLGVKISQPFDNFRGSPAPRNPDEYRAASYWMRRQVTSDALGGPWHGQEAVRASHLNG
jgi:hypothetical protein